MMTEEINAILKKAVEAGEKA
jgi:hypothetical protein